MLRVRCRVLGILLRGGLGDGFSLEDFEHCGIWVQGVTEFYAIKCVHAGFT